MTLDTTRADHLSCYGYERPTTPELERLAQVSERYTRAYATTSWTLPAHASIFTGKLPTSHGAKHADAGPLALSQALPQHPDWSVLRAQPVGADQATLAEVLQRAGYATGAVVAGPWLKHVFGLSRGFDSYDDAGITELNGRPADAVSDAAIRWLAERAGEPFFLFVNYFDPHWPYRAREPFGQAVLAGAPGVSTRLERDVAAYDAELRFVDHHLGRLLDHLRDSGRFEETLVVVTADHGELLGENGLMGHGRSLSEAELRIPLLVKRPGGASARVVDRLVQQTDLLPTILGVAGLPLPSGLQGEPLAESAHPIVAEVDGLAAVDSDRRDWRQRGDWRALVRADVKYLWGSRGRHALFDLRDDPREERDLAPERGAQASAMQRALLGFLRALPRAADAAPVEPDPATLRLLEGLGYGGDARGEGGRGD